MLTAEVAIYPLKSSNASDVINHSIDSLKSAKIDYQVDSMKTHLTGNNEDVFNSLKTMFSDAQNQGGEVSMVVTITNSARS